MNNPQQQFPPGMDPKQAMMNQMKIQFRTSGPLKFCIMILIGFLPMFIVWFGLNTGADRLLVDSVNLPWFNTVSYGAMWGIGLGVWALSICAAWFLVNRTKDFKIDIVGPVTSTSFIFFLMYITPALPLWGRILIILPCSFLMMGLSNIISYIIYFTKQTKGLREGMGDFKKIFEPANAQDMEDMMSKLDDQLRQQGINLDEFDGIEKVLNPKDIKAEVKIKDKEKKQLENDDKKKND